MPRYCHKVNKLKQLQPLILKQKYIEAVERDINALLWELLYQPIQEILGKHQIINSSNALSDAIRDGRIYYAGGKFSGNFNSSISKQLKAAGATYSKGEWFLPKNAIAPEISIAIAQAEMQFKQISKMIISQLDSVDYEKIIKSRKLDKTYKAVTDEMDAAFKKTVKSISIAPKLTDGMKDIISAEWGENLELYIQDWTKDNILKLRAEVEENAFAGQRAESLSKLIEKNYSVSRNKAKFLARQETSLLMSKFREQRYASVGITQYRWSTSNDERVREDHKLLDGEIFDFANPPITNRQTGARNNAGEDFGCRCLAIALVD